jgi:hypothetical protein
MKSICFLLGIFVLNSICGQEIKKVFYQINVGTSLTIPYKSKIDVFPDIADHPVYDYKPNIGYFGGVQIGYNFNDKVALFVGIDFTHSRLKIDSKTGITEIKGNINSSYLDFPLYLEYQLFENIPLKIGFGTYFSVLLNAKEKGTLYVKDSPISYSTSQPCNNDIKNRYKKGDFGIIGRVAYDFRLANKINALIYSKLNYGIVDVLKNQDNYKWKNYNLLIGIGIKI